MPDQSVKNIYLLGLGALGGLIAAKLHDAFPDSVKIIADLKRQQTIQQTGLTVNGKTISFQFITPSHGHGEADLVIIAVKNAQLAQAIQDIKSFIGENTIVISLLNGISSEELIGNGIGHEHLLYAYGVGMDAVRESSEIRYTNPGKIVFGEKDNHELSDRVKFVKELFDKAQIPYNVPVDMNKALWSKFMMNTGINQASAVLKAPYGAFQLPGEARELMLAAAGEVMELSVHYGVNLTQADVDDFLKILGTLDSAGKTSMLQDVEAGRETEVDLFAGTVLAMGKQYNLQAPVNEMLYKKIKSLR
ncbi:ketopantoate reductase [Mucilaginibacter mallensis]|uniref:2-dehydropantoate 2-reductase n=1 Tax=Mucilaginibacter mallensis TaxID=652787 RepID=A0A1H2CBE5_MUCMA|nr:ketopantoate reductase family protein [Mucilaginibacter mallensis]SDT67634.1 ketopantoate reductase [Mucilaginibacter mallensis]